MKDGTPILLRPIKPEDEALLNELFNSLSEETMKFRFFQIIRDMPHETLTRYCNLDYDREIAIVAETRESGRRMLGVARIILEPGGKSGEFAVVVRDEWQKRGLGSKLVDYIISISKDMKLETLYGYVGNSNSKMIQLCTKKGFQVKPYDEEVVKVSLRMSIP